MNKKPTIRLKIKIGGVEHEMGPDEVKTLRDALNELYPDPIRTIRHEYVPHNPWRDRWWYGTTTTGIGVGGSMADKLGAVAQNSALLELKSLANG